MESVKHYTKSRQILQRNVFRHCTDFTFPVSLLFLLPGPGGEELAIMMAPSPASRLMGREVWPRFRHLSLLLGFNMAGCLAAHKTRWRGRGIQVGGKKQTNTKRNTTCLWTKELRRMGGMERLLSVLGSVDLTSSILLAMCYIDVFIGCNYSQ